MDDKKLECIGSNKKISPILISGCYRSGTTFLSALCGSIPNYKSLSSGLKFLSFCFGRYGSLKKKENLHRLLTDTQIRLSERWNHMIDLERLNLNIDNSLVSYSYIYNLLMEEILFESNNENNYQWTDKVVLHWNYIKNFLLMFPKGKVIHVVRDPRAVLASFKKITFERNNTYLDALFNSFGSLKFAKEIIKNKSKNIYVLKIENLKNNNKDLLNKILQFLQLDYEADIFQASKMSTNMDNWEETLKFNKNYYKLKNKKPNFKWPKINENWKNYLTKNEVILCENMTLEYMKFFNYKTSIKSQNLSFQDMEKNFCNNSYLNSRFKKWSESGTIEGSYPSCPIAREVKYLKTKINIPVRQF